MGKTKLVFSSVSNKITYQLREFKPADKLEDSACTTTKASGRHYTKVREVQEQSNS